MLTHLRIEHFKSWRDTGEIRLAPLTLFFGGNSAGKSSIPQALLMLKQTAESTDLGRVLHMGDPKTIVDLGTYGDVVHQRRVDEPLRIALGWTLGEPLRIRDSLHLKDYEADAVRFDVHIAADRATQPIVSRFTYTLGDPDDPVLTAGMRRRGNTTTYDLDLEGYDAVRAPGRAWPLGRPFHFYGFPDEAVGYFQNTAFVSDLSLSLREELRAILYLGPLREYPGRLYHWSGEEQLHVGQRGERAIEAILAASKRRFNWKSKARRTELPALVAGYLKTMDLIQSFEVRPLGKNRKEHEVLVQTGQGLPKVALTDVGFGLSQVLPVVVECFAVPRRSIVIFEQPEIHLHPRVQADLADVFVDAISARENNSPRDVQFIIESHSEHFLRRLQLRIAEGKLPAENAAMYFVDMQAGESTLRTLDVDAFGNIRNWPENFFGDEMADLVGRAEAQAQRMAKQAGKNS